MFSFGLRICLYIGVGREHIVTTVVIASASPNSIMTQMHKPYQRLRVYVFSARTCNMFAVMSVLSCQV